MTVETVHAVDGVGTHRTHTNREFDPRVFEQAVHGLQELVLGVVRYEDERQEDDDYAPDHEVVEGEDGEKCLRVVEDTVLHDVINYMVPRKWDVSVTLDQIREYGYGVYTKVDCGGGVSVYAKIFVENGWIRRLDVGHDSLTDPEDSTEGMEVTSLGRNSSSREIAHLNRYLDRAVISAYAMSLESAATAFDYIATKEDIPAGGSRTASARDLRERVAQKDWAEVREKTQQTVSDNVRAARDALGDRPDDDPFCERKSALEEIDADADDPGIVRLV